MARPRTGWQPPPATVDLTAIVVGVGGESPAASFAPGAPLKAFTLELPEATVRALGEHLGKPVQLRIVRGTLTAWAPAGGAL